MNFGSFPVGEVVEWIEANRMFGVTRFYIYDGTVEFGIVTRALYTMSEWVGVSRMAFSGVQSGNRDSHVRVDGVCNSITS